jgi:hypothetical protein
MSDEEIIQILRAHFEGLFPKACNTCGRNYPTLKEYILKTDRLQGSISYDAEVGNWDTSQPIGGVVFANCHCGTTLALTTEGMPLSTFHTALNWIRNESKRRGMTPTELLEYIRNEVRKRVLADSG